jgi:hypothetical protein
MSRDNFDDLNEALEDLSGPQHDVRRFQQLTAERADFDNPHIEFEMFKTCLLMGLRAGRDSQAAIQNAQRCTEAYLTLRIRRIEQFRKDYGASK